MQTLPPLNSLRYFLVAAQTQSFKQAAEQLFVTQAAISQHIKTLETHIGLPLFKRGVRQVTLTQEGARLLPHIQAGFEQFTKGLQAINNDSHPNVLNITVVESLSTRFLVPRLQSFVEQHPDIKVRLDPTNITHTFDKADIDLAIRFGLGNYPNLESRLLIDDKYVLVCHPRLVSKNMTVDDLYHLPLLEEQGPITGLAWKTFLQQHDLKAEKFNKVLEVDDSTLTIIEAVLAGQGIAMLRYNLIYQQIQRKQLVQLFDYGFPSTFSYYLVAPPHYFNKTKVKLFEKWLRAELALIT